MLNASCLLGCESLKLAPGGKWEEEGGPEEGKRERETKIYDLQKLLLGGTITGTIVGPQKHCPFSVPISQESLKDCYPNTKLI